MGMERLTATEPTMATIATRPAVPGPRANADLSRFPMPIAPCRKYDRGPSDMDPSVGTALGVASAILATYSLLMTCSLLQYIFASYSYPISITAFWGALALAAFAVATVRGRWRRARERLERHRAAIRAALARHAPGAHVHADVAQLTAESCRGHRFFVMVDLASPELTRGAVVYDVHQVRQAWPYLLDDDADWVDLFNRVKVTESDDNTCAHVLYTARRDVGDFDAFLSAAARADLYKQRLLDDTDSESD
ncbi:hypothetical protein pqer_cds_1180 [Pandoravirus quercus]|uniref:Uncharacterized protein n=1 Tax=Pandoravirus quercus TaxID=2107709 RepID=A0A2U7UB24_9VIRU|nr:hypothetical protein pqer_cds_19 [Pandoravirus quercus]YP_009483871.1 hypothetical protein pqer_cds_1180 [Pandoravirus quercus]AVK74441.1 hypothetical protein pqer_cds_19 [Pandoravirus quercus]AVK75602.1 hypothetical protein pqer_cds_1180 [Pandoravirus quercus]